MIATIELLGVFLPPNVEGASPKEKSIKLRERATHLKITVARLEKWYKI